MNKTILDDIWKYYKNVLKSELSRTKFDINTSARDLLGILLDTTVNEYLKSYCEFTFYSDEITKHIADFYSYEKCVYVTHDDMGRILVTHYVFPCSEHCIPDLQRVIEDFEIGKPSDSVLEQMMKISKELLMNITIINESEEE